MEVKPDGWLISWKFSSRNGWWLRAAPISGNPQSSCSINPSARPRVEVKLGPKSWCPHDLSVVSGTPLDDQWKILRTNYSNAGLYRMAPPTSSVQLPYKVASLRFQVDITWYNYSWGLISNFQLWGHYPVGTSCYHRVSGVQCRCKKYSKYNVGTTFTT